MVEEPDVVGFERLPGEMVLAVIELLPLGTRMLCRAVSRQWRAVVAPPPQRERERREVREDCMRHWPLRMMPETLWSKSGTAVCSVAAKVGRLDVIRLARRKGCPWDEEACGGAAEGGHLDVLKWIRHMECPWDKQTCAAAAAGGHLDVLKWARLKGCPHNNGCPWNERTCQKASLLDYKYTS